MVKLRRRLFTVVAVGLLAVFGAGCGKVLSAHHMRRADKYFAAGQYSKAEVEYLVVLRRSRADAHAFSRLGTIYFEEGRTGRAFAYLTKACELTPNDVELHFKLGCIYLTAGKQKEAAEQAKFVLDKMPTHAEAPSLLAESVSSTNELTEVREYLGTLSGKYGDSAALQLAVGTLEMRAGNGEGAEAAFKRAQSLDPKSSAAWFAIGAVCLTRNDLTNADLALKTASELSPPRSVRRVAYANFKIRTGQVEAGKQILSDITKAAPDYAPAWLRQAEVAFGEADYTNCLAFLNRALAQDPSDYDALLLKGRMRLAQGEASKAVVEFQRMSTIYSRSPQVQYYLARAYLLGNDSVKAQKSLSQALALDPHYAEAILLQAQLDTARGNIAPVIASLTELLKRQPRLPQAHLELAAAYQAKGDLEAALAAYRRLGDLFPKSAETPYRMGLIYLQQKQKTGARDAFTRTVELAPDYLPAVERLVDLDLADGQYETAFARVQAQIEKHPKAAEPHLLEAKVYLARANEKIRQEIKRQNLKRFPDAPSMLAKLPEAQKDMDQAEAVLLKCVEQNPGSQEAYLLLARLYVDMKKSDKAIAELEQALAKDPKNVNALLLVAMTQSEAKNYSAAREAFEKLLAIKPDSYIALNNLAYIYSEQFGLFDKAYELASHARELLSYKANAETGEAQAGARNTTEFLRAYSTGTLGWVLFRKHQYPWALSLLQESSEKLGALPEEQFHLGMAYYMLGQEDRAQTAFKLALSSDKDFTSKEEVTRRLALLALDPQTAGPSVLTDLEKQLKDQPGDPVVLRRLVAIYQRDGKPDKIQAAYEAALKENAQNAPVLARLAQFYAAPGTLHDSQRALDLAKQAYKVAPEAPDAAGTLGRLVFLGGQDYKWALSLLQEAAARQGQSPELLYHLAWAYYSVGRVSEAQTTMRKALDGGSLSSCEEEAKMFLELVGAAADPAQTPGAEPKAQQILKAHSDDVPALMVMALAAEKNGQLQPARQAYERALGVYPDFTPAKKRLACLYADGEDPKAYDMAVAAREAFPDDVEVARALGIAFYRRGDYTSASRLLTETVRNGGEDARTQYYLGMSNFQLKNKQGKQNLQRALSLNLEPKLAEDAKRVLSQLN